MALDFVRRAGTRHWHTDPITEQMEKTEGFGGEGRPKSFSYP